MALRQSGIKAEDSVGLLGSNSLFWVACYLAIMKLGAVAVPFSTMAMPDEVQAQVEFSGCKAVCVQDRFFGRYQSALQEVNNQFTDDCLQEPMAVTWKDLPFEPDFDENREAALMFTSGTTQRPRAVRISHKNIRANTDSIIEYLELDENERIMVVLPFYYCFGTSLLHTHLRVNGSMVISNGFTFPEIVLDLMEKYATTGIAGVPSTYQTLIRNTSLARRNLPALRKVQQAGGKLPAVQTKELADLLPQANIYTMYGQTEATARLSYLPPKLLATKLGSIGKGIPGVELRVMSESGTPVQPGEVGEIWARGDNISAGYLNDPDASAEKFIDGVLHTGDLATVDEDGYIFVVDRKADFIKSYGYRVSSQQVEDCVLALQDVVAAAAIGEPDPMRGEAIVVFITLREGSSLKVEEILAHCRAKLARHMVPKRIQVMDSLPLSAQGKVLKSELRKTITPVK
jgi:acyl-CoA synthetase (AMP-forming)/AMP-acid ligase II